MGQMASDAEMEGALGRGSDTTVPWLWAPRPLSTDVFTGTILPSGSNFHVAGSAR